MQYIKMKPDALMLILHTNKKMKTKTCKELVGSIIDLILMN
jgi:hypothetical protein